MFNKPGPAPFLFDTSGNIAGCKNADGTERLFSSASFTWAGLPPASRFSGSTVLVSDVGVAPGIRVVSDGTRWMAAGAQVLARSWTAVAAPADTSENTLATVSIPAGLLGINGALRITAQWSETNSGNNKTHRIKLGATAVWSTVQTTAVIVPAWSQVGNRGAANSQVASNAQIAPFSAGTAATTAAIDTSAAASLTFTSEKATGAETVALDFYTVEVLP